VSQPPTDFRRATVRRIANLAIVVFSTVGIGAGAYAVVMW